ncbi:MAG TPA: molybdate ABC transporter substrate-binding protein [Chloroflexota bacterium]|nr:molybdate ABC transporter substrate-binding protein [Chloroflexota bacterium]
MSSNEIVVFAAGSLVDSFAELQTAFERQEPATEVRLRFASADQLRRAIGDGARAEVFASADWAQMREAQHQGLIVGEPRAFATNRLTLLISRANPRRISSLADLARDDLRLAAEHTDAPLTVYTRALLANLGRAPVYGPTLARQIERALVPTARTVREIVTQVVDGKADAGIVYLTDYTPSVQSFLTSIEIPADVNITATYTIALTRTGTNLEAAAAFVDLVCSSVGQRILARWGFGPAAASEAR